MIIENLLKQKLQSGKAVLGTWNTLSSPLVTEVLAQGGLDFQIIDLEHGPYSLGQVYLQVSACENVSDCTPLVRVPANEDWMILQALDQGAHGVVVPHISNSEAAQKMIFSARYHPMGKRGFTPFSKAGGFTDHDAASYVERANSSALSVAIIESREGLENLDQILAVDGIDIVYFGAYDLSQALGYPGEVRHPEVVAAIQRGVQMVTTEGRWAGGFVPQSRDDIKWLLDIGMRFITYQVDSNILYNHTNSISEWFDEETG